MRVAVALAFAALLLLAGCTSRTLSSGNLYDDWNYCKDGTKLKLKIERARCLHNLAVLHAEEPEAVSICADIRTAAIGSLGAPFEWVDDAVVKNIRNDCYYEVAVRKAERQAEDGTTGFGTGSAIADVCGNIKGTTDPDVDEESGNMMLRDRCFAEVALILEDKGVCDRISSDATIEKTEIDPGSGEPETKEISAIQNCKDQIP